MTERELNICLREMAREAGLCDEWYGAWKDDSTIDECLDRYIRGHDFAVKHDWPAVDFIRENFTIHDLHRHNIYLDEGVQVEAENGYYVFLGDSKATVVADGFKAVTIYCRHDSEVNVRAFNGARVFVTYYDRSSGVCKSDDWSTCKSYDRNR